MVLLILRGRQRCKLTKVVHKGFVKRAVSLLLRPPNLPPLVGVSVNCSADDGASSCGRVGNGPLSEGIRGNKIGVQIHAGERAKRSEAEPASQTGRRLVQVGYVPAGGLVSLPEEQTACRQFTHRRLGHINWSQITGPGSVSLRDKTTLGRERQ